MVKKGRRKIKIPIETPNNDLLDDTIRDFPSLDCLTPTELETVEKRTRNLMEFLDLNRIPFTVEQHIKDKLKRFHYEQKDLFSEDISKKKKYFFKDPWDGESLIIVKEGTEPITSGLNLLIAHSDSPCLRLKPRPFTLEWDPQYLHDYPGVRLSALPHGGIDNFKWVSQSLRLQGYHIEKDLSKRFIDLPGATFDIASHTSFRESEILEQAFPGERSLEIILGYKSKKDLLDGFEFESLDDFTTSKLFAVPINPPQAIDESSWRLLGAYGLDNKLGTYTSIDAILSANKPKLTSIVWITDNEEVGDPLPTGVEGGFFDLAMDYILTKHENQYDEGPLSEREKRRILTQSSLLYIDIDIAPSASDKDNIDLLNAPRLGFGVSINTAPQYISSQVFAKKLENLTLYGKSRGNNILHQLVGNADHQDRSDQTLYETMHGEKNQSFRYFGQYAFAIGVACACTHSMNEQICPGDELMLYKFLRRFLEHNTIDKTWNGNK